MISIFHSSLLQINDWLTSFYCVCCFNEKGQKQKKKLSQYFFVSSFPNIFYCCCYIYVVTAALSNNLALHTFDNFALAAHFFGVLKTFWDLQNFYLFFHCSFFLLMLWLLRHWNMKTSSQHKLMLTIAVFIHVSLSQ